MSLEELEQVLILWVSRRYSWVASYLETVDESNVSGRRNRMIDSRLLNQWLTSGVVDVGFKV